MHHVPESDSKLTTIYGARIMYMELTNTVSNPYMLSSDANSGQVIMQMCHYTYNHRSIPIRMWGGGYRSIIKLCIRFWYTGVHS